MNTVRLLLQPTRTPSTGGSPGESSVPSVNHLSTGILVFLLVVAATLIAGTLVAVMLDRSRTDGSTGRRSAPMTRSMLAVLLVGTLSQPVARPSPSTSPPAMRTPHERT